MRRYLAASAAFCLLAHPSIAFAGASNQVIVVGAEEVHTSLAVVFLIYGTLAAFITGVVLAPRIFLGPLFILAVVILPVTFAFAQATPAIPAGHDVVIPYGEIIAQVGGIAQAVLLPALLAFLTWAAAHGPAWVASAVAIMRTQRGQQLIQGAIDYGINAVSGATKDGQLPIHVASPVIENALEYALSSGAPQLIAWLGGETGIKAKIFRSLNLDPAVTATALGVAPPKPAS